ncbi:hypothetical protein N658DRAFT_494971 [Parathielavia hyrcaniae]|uniref:Uncharacterized protein n=1 Tax=Parathielavia hyrcaniae TaxID=113614 RepID=A0AAN6Q621_9PEZI|nr:hypothetical protein N658DRAFT_494971 [Parathielavia hyrcaniae]
MQLRDFFAQPEKALFQPLQANPSKKTAFTVLPEGLPGMYHIPSDQKNCPVGLQEGPVSAVPCRAGTEGPELEVPQAIPDVVSDARHLRRHGAPAAVSAATTRKKSAYRLDTSPRVHYPVDVPYIAETSIPESCSPCFSLIYHAGGSFGIYIGNMYLICYT